MWFWLYQSLRELYVLSAELLGAHRLSVVCIMLEVTGTVVIKVEIVVQPYLQG